MTDGSTLGATRKPVRILGTINPPVSAVEWPGKTGAPTTAVTSLPFVKGAVMTSSTTTPEITWPDYPGAVSYRVYIGRSNLASYNLVLAQVVTSGRKLQTATAQFTKPLVNGVRYVFTVFPRNALGASMLKSTTGLSAFFSVVLPIADTGTAGEIALTKSMINDVSSSTLGDVAWWNRENTPLGTITWKGILTSSSTEKVTSASLIFNSTESVALTLDASGGFTHERLMKVDAIFTPMIRVVTSNGRTVDFSPGPKTLNYRHMTQTEEIREVLTKLADAYRANDRVSLLKLIDRDYISSATGFRDYQELDNSLRDHFNVTTTSTCRWNSEDIRIITPAKRLEVTFQWRRNINYSTLNTTRDYQATARLDIRKIDGVWLIHEDFGRTIFATDLGPVPAPPQ